MMMVAVGAMQCKRSPGCGIQLLLTMKPWTCNITKYVHSNSMASAYLYGHFTA